MNVYILTQTWVDPKSFKTEFVGVYINEQLARDRLAEIKGKLLENGPWLAVDEQEDGRVLTYAGNGVAFIPGYYRITEHEVITG